MAKKKTAAPASGVSLPGFSRYKFFIDGSALNIAMAQKIVLNKGYIRVTTDTGERKTLSPERIAEMVKEKLSKGNGVAQPKKIVCPPPSSDKPVSTECGPGIKAPSRVLTIEDVREIRRLAGIDTPRKEIAEKYKVHTSTIGAVLSTTGRFSKIK